MGITLCYCSIKATDFRIESMMLKQKVYLDTTVPSAYCDDRTPERQNLTMQFWLKRLPDFQPFISDVVLTEIDGNPNVIQRNNIQKLVEDFEILNLDDESRRLARDYIERGVFSEKNLSDANHVAIAVVNNLNYLVSWNFRHLVKVNTRRLINLSNILLGFGQIEIIAPPEL
jgi:hypothetical protein